MIFLWSDRIWNFVRISEFTCKLETFVSANNRRMYSNNGDTDVWHTVSRGKLYSSPFFLFFVRPPQSPGRKLHAWCPASLRNFATAFPRGTKCHYCITLCQHLNPFLAENYGHAAWIDVRLFWGDVRMTGRVFQDFIVYYIGVGRYPHDREGVTLEYFWGLSVIAVFSVLFIQTGDIFSVGYQFVITVLSVNNVVFYWVQIVEFWHSFCSFFKKILNLELLGKRQLIISTILVKIMSISRNSIASFIILFF